MPREPDLSSHTPPATKNKTSQYIALTNNKDPTYILQKLPSERTTLRRDSYARRKDNPAAPLYHLPLQM